MLPIHLVGAEPKGYPLTRRKEGVWGHVLPIHLGGCGACRLPIRPRKERGCGATCYPSTSGGAGLVGYPSAHRKKGGAGLCATHPPRGVWGRMLPIHPACTRVGGHALPIRSEREGLRIRTFACHDKEGVRGYGLPIHLGGCGAESYPSTQLAYWRQGGAGLRATRPPFQV